ncbi:MAG: N-acetylmuramoyl-L-alanine amidase [Clostridia bacterium]|nr:N-acetylmuramoyl-L-alanine amidase [Clostridia bacterium]
MKKKWKEWAAFAAACLLLAIGLAIPARPAKPAQRARPVHEAAGPLSGRILFLDAGHGGIDGGARAKDSGKWEKEINLQVTEKLQKLLLASGAQVIMSRESDMEYSQNKRQDLTARLEKAASGKAEMLISIHMNEYRDRSESGPQVFYRKGQEKSRLLAGVMQEQLIQGLNPSKERSALSGDYFMLSLNIPSVLIECGFLSNSAEEAMLLSPEYQYRIAKAIHDGIIEYFSLSSP